MSHTTEKNTLHKVIQIIGYSVREIIFVVIGILIAVYFNNLNEQAKTKAKEIEILEGVLLDLSLDTADLNDNITSYKRLESECDAFFEVVAQSDGYPEDRSVYNIIRWVIDYNTTFQCNDASYTMAVEEGMSIISNSSLRRDLINLYNKEINNILFYVNESSFTNSDDFLREQFTPYISYDPVEKVEQLGVEIFTDPHLLYVISIWQKQTLAKLTMSEKLVRDMENLMADIEQELDLIR